MARTAHFDGIVHRSALFAAVAALLMTACASIAGLDNEYELGDPGSGGQGGSGGSAQSSSTSTGTAGGAGGGVGGGGTAGAGGAGAEDCFDGVDNDNDGLIDCLDLSNCAAVVECVPAIPAGFTRYVRYQAASFMGAPTAPPLCPGGLQAEGFFAGPGDPSTCAACSCSWPGAACSAPTIECFQSNILCASGADYTTTAMNANCIPLPNFNPGGMSESCRIATPAVVSNPGMCMTSGGAETEAPMWKEEIFVCSLGATAGGCESGQMCAPKPQGDFTGLLCIATEGEVPCPSGWMTEQRIVYKGGNDNRACSSCACTSGVSCVGGSYTVYDNDDCTGTFVLVANANCVDATDQLGPSGSLKATLPTLMNGGCAGGDPTGAVEGTLPTTICCQ